MFTNPFTPMFGGKPDFFFGREELLKRFKTAMVDQGSEYRALFITGTRGFGKTAILEQFSQIASGAGWKVVDIGSDKPVETVVRRLAGATETATSINPSIGVSVLGTGGSLGGVSSSKTNRYAREDLGTLILETCKKEKGGLLLTVDEIQKIDLDDVTAICDAFQIASRKGCNAMLAVAGLPYSHSSIIQHEGCTYLRRGVHESVVPLSPDEVQEAFVQAFGLIPGFEISDEACELLVQTSKGHPYIMQLLGYYLVENANENPKKRTYHATLADAERAVSRALDAYALRAVSPIVDAMPKSAANYLRAMSQVIDEERIAKTGEIARELGKSPQAAAQPRQYLIDNGIIISAERGKVVFGIPYVDDFMLNRREEKSELLARRAWGY